ncbi:MAG TPA: hypothetical protein VGG99_11305 [Acetobacteraceae bacterium]
MAAPFCLTPLHRLWRPLAARRVPATPAGGIVEQPAHEPLVPRRG